MTRCCYIIICVLLLCSTCIAEEELGVRTRCQIERWIDGDTVEISVTYKARIRLLDCWAPETRGESRPDGLAAKEFVSNKWPAGTNAILFIPTSGAKHLGSVLTFGRLLGNLSVEGKDLSEAIREAGHATKTKSGGR